ncbi:MAG: hypothetical protein AAF550_13180 [Myxococcota bacterium]
MSKLQKIQSSEFARFADAIRTISFWSVGLAAAGVLLTACTDSVTIVDVDTDAETRSLCARAGETCDTALPCCFGLGCDPDTSLCQEEPEGNKGALGNFECPESVSAGMGTSCTHEGQRCSSCLFASCEYCDELRCREGMWIREVVPPASDCSDAGAQDSGQGGRCAQRYQGCNREVECCTEHLFCDWSQPPLSGGGDRGGTCIVGPPTLVSGDSCDPSADRCSTGLNCCLVYGAGGSSTSFACAPACTGGTNCFQGCPQS